MGPRNTELPPPSLSSITSSYRPAASIATEAAKERLQKIASDFVVELIAVVDSVLRSQNLALAIQRAQIEREYAVPEPMPELMTSDEPDLGSSLYAEWTEEFEWFAAQLPTWEFSLIEAKIFLREYADLSSPILRNLERKRLLVRSGTTYKLTPRGRETRRTWAHPFVACHENPERRDLMTCPRTMKWQGEGAATLDNFELARVLGVIILDNSELRKEIVRALEAHNELIAEDSRDNFEIKTSGDSSLSYYVAVALQSWTDGEQPIFREELMEEMLKVLPPQELVLLQRTRNGCPLLKRYIAPGIDGKKLD